jgi:hypothetical protein
MSRMLSASDRGRLKSEAAELPLAEPRWISHGFSFPFYAEGAFAVASVLRRRRGFERVWVGEEITGDGYWHVVAWRRQSVTHRALSNARRLMGKLAADHGGVYDGWSHARDYGSNHRGKL